MYVMTGRPMSLVFVAMSPLMMIGSFLDNRHQQRKEGRARARDFDAALALSEKELEAAHERERAIRLARSPSTAEVCSAIRLVAPPLWTHRPEHEAFLEVRLGVGSVPTSMEIEAPALSNAVEGTWERVAGLRDRFTSIGGVPVTASLREAGGLGIAGGAPEARAVARATGVPVAGLH
jgi:S-DNA-T family DNA segregation ATPase FtsK/SpoIIIE